MTILRKSYAIVIGIFFMAVMGLPAAVFAETDVSDKVQLIQSRLLFDRLTSQNYLDVSVKNISNEVLLTPIKIVIDSISTPDVTVANADGVTSEGKPYFEYMTNTGQFLSGETTGSKRIKFNNPKVARFTFTKTVHATIPEAAAVIGSEGGVISSQQGLKAIIPGGALPEDTIVSLASADIDSFRIDTDMKESVDILGIMEFNIGDKELLQNAELAFPLPDSTISGENLYLAKIIKGQDADMMAIVDRVGIVGNELISQYPPFPGAIKSGVYGVIRPNTICGIPNLNSFFKISPDCSQRLDAIIFMKDVSKNIEAHQQMILASAENKYDEAKALQTLTKLTENAASLLQLSSLGPEKLIELGIRKSISLTGVLFSDELAQLITNHAVCMAETYITGNMEACVGVVLNDLVRLATDPIAIRGYCSAIQQSQDLLIARQYLWDYYSFGGDESLLADYVNAASSSRIDIIKSIAERLGYDGFIGMECLLTRDYNPDEVDEFINNCIAQVAEIRKGLDSNGNGIVDIVEPVVETTNKIPDTGQTTSYTNTFGEDSDYNINPQSYTKLDANGNALPDSASQWVMVKDNVTGLIWENKTDDGGIHDKDNYYTWYDAQSVFITQLNNSNFGGHLDWRLPTAMELSMLVHADKPYPGPTINTTYFQNTMSSFCWSSATYASYPDGAWLVDFYRGYVHYDNKSYSCYVRAVRGGQ
ncbi:DUF1566 domain-containing protein [Desulfobacterium sp. N47]|uniref:Lcl C-terminal domain-containing protein n=1 Tax=Desulfobacterium sp. N47 TaxID=3115210 RepID=UPI003F4A5741